MLSNEEKEAYRRKIRQELEEQEKERLEELTKKPPLEPTAEPAFPITSDRVPAISSSAPAPFNGLSHQNWAEIEKIKRDTEEAWYSQNPDYVKYSDRHGNKKWIHRKQYEQKKAQENIRRTAEVKRRKKIYRNLILSGVVIMALLVVIIHYMLPHYGCAAYVNSNIDGAAIFIDGKRTAFDTDALVTTLTPGAHQISVYKPGYTTGFQDIFAAKGDTITVEINLEIDPQYAEIAAGRRPDTTIEENKTPIYIPGSAPKPEYVVDRERTSMVISTNISDVVVKMDGKPTSYEVNRLLQSVPPGSHIVELVKAGYRSEPAYAIINLQKGGAAQYLTFEMIRESALVLTIRTEPVDGDIFLDNILMGHGECIREFQLPGRFTVSFGKVRGFRSPDDITVQISEREPSVSTVGRYYPIIEIAFSLGQNGQIVKNNVKEVRTGYYYPNTGPVPAEETGPALQKLDAYNIYVYEMGYAFAHRNPPGGDFVEIVFDLPENFNQNKILYLTLRGLASNKNYLFNLTKSTDIAVEINGKVVVNHHTPINNLDRQEPLGGDSWPISDFLKMGENRILVRTTDDNKCYYYLHALELK